MAKLKQQRALTAKGQPTTKKAIHPTSSASTAMARTAVTKSKTPKNPITTLKQRNVIYLLLSRDEFNLNPKKATEAFNFIYGKDLPGGNITMKVLRDDWARRSGSKALKMYSDRILKAKGKFSRAEIQARHDALRSIERAVVDMQTNIGHVTLDMGAATDAPVQVSGKKRMRESLDGKLLPPGWELTPDDWEEPTEEFDHRNDPLLNRKVKTDTQTLPRKTRSSRARSSSMAPAVSNGQNQTAQHTSIVNDASDDDEEDADGEDVSVNDAIDDDAAPAGQIDADQQEAIINATNTTNVFPANHVNVGQNEPIDHSINSDDEEDVDSSDDTGSNVSDARPSNLLDTVEEELEEDQDVSGDEDSDQEPDDLDDAAQHTSGNVEDNIDVGQNVQVEDVAYSANNLNVAQNARVEDSAGQQNNVNGSIPDATQQANQAMPDEGRAEFERNMALWRQTLDRILQLPPNQAIAFFQAAFPGLTHNYAAQLDLSSHANIQAAWTQIATSFRNPPMFHFIDALDHPDSPLSAFYTPRLRMFHRINIQFAENGYATPEPYRAIPASELLYKRGGPVLRTHNQRTGRFEDIMTCNTDFCTICGSPPTFNAALDLGNRPSVHVNDLRRGQMATEAGILDTANFEKISFEDAGAVPSSHSRVEESVTFIDGVTRVVWTCFKEQCATCSAPQQDLQEFVFDDPFPPQGMAFEGSFAPQEQGQVFGGSFA